MKHKVFILLVVLFFSCNNENERKIAVFNNYFEALKEESDQKWLYTTDTVKLWFDKKEGEPILIVKNDTSTGKWAGWDKVMKSKSYYDSIWFEKSEQVIRGYFFEENDFYKLINKKPTKTLRSYWLNDNNKIEEILIYWIPGVNTTTAQHLKPIIAWAEKYDSLRLSRIYQNGIIPSAENAREWKELINEYNEMKK